MESGCGRGEAQMIPCLRKGPPQTTNLPWATARPGYGSGGGCGMVGVSAPGGWQQRGRRARRRMRWQRRPRRRWRRRRRVRRRVARGSFGRSLGRDPGSLYDAPFAPPPPRSPKKWTSPVDVAQKWRIFWGGVQRGAPPLPDPPPDTLHLNGKP